jgi:hypothetical protein
MEYSAPIGQTWSTVQNINLGGSGAAFSFLGHRDGWVLASGTGLWQTTNGRSWVEVDG